MYPRRTFSRRNFLGGTATALGYLGLAPGRDLWAQGLGPLPNPYEPQEDDYDALVKLNFNENPYGPAESVMEAMNGAWKYSNRYGYPDGDVRQAIADHHGVETQNILMGAGSGEILKVVGLTYLSAGKKVIGVEPSYSAVYSHAAGIRADAITLPLMEDYRQNIPEMIRTTNQHHREVGFVYLCNPNNPTGRTVSAREVRQLLDGIPEDVPVLIDEAYHHFVEDPEYATAVPYVLEGRPVIIARTFSKIYGMAAMRLGYAVATPEIISRMSNYSTGTQNCLVKWGGAAALRDTEAEANVRRVTLELRKKTSAELEAMGYEVIPSETNFIMVNCGRRIDWVRDEFRKRGVAVGRDFPPMLEHLRVSIGTEEEMATFMSTWKDVFSSVAAAGSGGG